MDWEPSILREYLLRNASDEKLTELDVELLSNREFRIAVEVAEEELVDDYLDEMLSPSELERFEALFLNSPSRTRMLELSRQLKLIARHDTGTEPATASSNYPRATGLLSGLRRIFLRPVFAVSVFALLLLAVTLAYFVFENRLVKKPLEDSELAQLNQKDLSNLSEYDSLTRLTLLSEATRDSGSLRVLSIGSMSDPILIRLSLPTNITSERLRIEITAGNMTTANLENAKVYTNQSGRDVRILVPRARLTVGRYSLRIVETQSNISATYLFDVQP